MEMDGLVTGTEMKDKIAMLGVNLKTIDKKGFNVEGQVTGKLPTPVLNCGRSKEKRLQTHTFLSV